MRTCCKFLFICGILLLATAAVAQAPASIFQLDGNAAPSAGYPTCVYGTCDNWNELNGAGGGVVTQTQSPPTASGNWSARTFINGTASTDSFQGGGSKDSNLISGWAWSGSPTPNKDTLNAGYAAGYSNAGLGLTDFDVIFGANRASPNGDANIGIWFFQQTVAPVAGGSFSGAHADHDIFVISAFTNGGGTSTISVYEWDHTCASGVKNPSNGQCADTNLRLLANPSTVCGSSYYCAITNSATTNSSWGGSLASPLFFEGGVDITQALATVGVTNLPCFTSFLEETRSSQSTTAVLKDFVAGGFPVCGLSVSKQCGTAQVDASGNYIDFPVSGTVTNTGIGTMYNVTVSDAITFVAGSSNNTPSTPATFSVTPSTLSAGQTGTWGANLTSTASSVSDQATADGQTASTGGTTVTSTPTGVITCQGAFTSTIKMNKMCNTTLVAGGGDVHVVVNYNGTVCNTGPAKISGLSMSDYPDNLLANGTSIAAGSIGSLTLAPCTTVDGTTGLCDAPATACTTYSGSYDATNIDITASGGTGPGRYFFNDEAVVTGATPSVGTLNKVSSTGSDPGNGQYSEGSASCPICQGSGECTAQ